MQGECSWFPFTSYLERPPISEQVGWVSVFGQGRLFDTLKFEGDLATHNHGLVDRACMHNMQICVYI